MVVYLLAPVKARTMTYSFPATTLQALEDSYYQEPLLCTGYGSLFDVAMAENHWPLFVSSSLLDLDLADDVDNSRLDYIL